MPTLILGITILLIVLWVTGKLSRTNPKGVARTLKSARDALDRASGRTSRHTSRFIELQIDHDTGAVRGRVLAGRHQGVPLDALDATTLTAMLGDVDDNSRALLVAYLDRRHPGWREHAQRHAASGNAAASGKMTEQEAYQILGLQPGADAGDITRAHRALMKKLHPDQGGSTYLAARVNEAKDTLLRTHNG